MKYFQGSRGGALLSGAQRCELRLLGLRCREGQVQRQDGAGEAEGVGDELRRAGEGGRQDHLHGESPNSRHSGRMLIVFCFAGSRRGEG